jgi:hypothetical protein
MTYEEKLREYRDARNAIWLGFLQAHAKDAGIIFLFFEDRASQALYVPAAKRHFGEIGIRPFPCRNKKDVLRLHEQISESGVKKRRTLFFVDRDHDDFLGAIQTNTDEIFYTSFYSIENYLVTSDMFECVLIQKICVDENVCDVAELVAKFERKHFEFLEKMRPFMIWVIFHRKARAALNLGNVKMSDLFDIDDEFRVRKRVGAFDAFRKQAGVSEAKVSVREILKLFKSLGDMSSKTLVRGKYEMWFFLRCLDRVRNILRLRASKGERGLFIPLQIDQNSIFSLVGASWNLEPELGRFLSCAYTRFTS